MRRALCPLLIALTPIASAGAAPAARVETAVPGTAAPFLAAGAAWYAAASRTGSVSFFAAGTGAPAGQIELKEGIAACPVALEDRLAVPLAGGGVDLLSAPDGRLVARIPTGAQVPHLAVSAVGFLVAEPEGAVSLIDPATGSARWRTLVASAPSAPPTLCGTQVLVGTAQGGMIALAPDDGRLLWSERLGGPITSPVTCDGRRAWVGSSDNQLHAFKPGRRGLRRLWAFHTGGDVLSRPIIHREVLLFFSYDTYLYALKARNGHLSWKARLGRRPQAESLISGELLLVAPLNAERLDIFRVADGAQAGSLTLPAGVERLVTPPVAMGESFLIGIARYGEESSRIAQLDPRDLLAPTVASPP